MPGTYGYYERTKPRLRVRRGWPGNEATAITESLPPKADENIKSGMLVIKQDVSGTLSWVKATQTLLDSLAVPPAWAYHDQSDPDVESAGLLLGLSSSGKFELETAYFDAGTYNPGDNLSASTTAGQVAGRGAGEHKIGVVHRGKIDYSAAADDPNNAFNSEAGSDTFDGNLLSIVTEWQPVLS